MKDGPWVRDLFHGGPSPYWVRYAVGHGHLEPGEASLRLVLVPSPAERLSDAQIHDYPGGRRSFRWSPPLELRVRARFSHPAGEFLGTAGFGFWNHPFTHFDEVVAPPNNVWFFYASPPSAMELVPGIPGWGWKAAVLDGGRLPGVAMAMAGLLLRLPVLAPVLARQARRYVRAAEELLPGDLTVWHDYRLRWQADGCTFWMDGNKVLSTPYAPRSPLGFVAWVDNQYAVARPDGRFAFGRLAIPRRQWLELESVEIGPCPRES
ncbi:MAG: hypothetical protein ACP5SI_06585 [Chloroflexia bacterium]